MENYQDRIGSSIQIPNIGRGKVKYIGPVDTKPGVFVGVDLLANIGKNDGSFNGTRYFSTEYPRSGLFIQFAKVEVLLQQDATVPVPVLPEQTHSSRRTTMSPAPSLGRSVRMTTSVRDIPPLLSHNSHDDDDSMEIDGFSSSVMVDQPPPTRTSHGTLTPSSNYDAELQELKERIKKYEALVDEQRVVFEELQPVMDASERRTKLLEEERDELRRQLEQEHKEQQERREYFDREHGELMTVVEGLQQEIDANEKRMTSAPQQQSIPQDILDQLESLQSYKKDMEMAQVKWAKEKEQLRMHNDSLGKEYAALNKELMQLSNGSQANNDTEALTQQVDALERQLAAARKEIRELHSSKDTREAEAQSTAPPQFCVLCEQPGHDQTHCPKQYENPT